jgi:hypothetical protein
LLRRWSELLIDVHNIFGTDGNDLYTSYQHGNTERAAAGARCAQQRLLARVSSTYVLLLFDRNFAQLLDRAALLKRCLMLMTCLYCAHHFTPRTDGHGELLYDASEVYQLSPMFQMAGSSFGSARAFQQHSLHVHQAGDVRAQRSGPAGHVGQNNQPFAFSQPLQEAQGEFVIAVS